MLIAVNYHYCRPTFEYPFPGVHGITPTELEQQLRLLGSVGEFVTPMQVRRAVRGEMALPERALLVTFDDGFREQFEFALPVLERAGVDALFFVNPTPIARQTVSTVHKIHLLSAHLSPGRVWTMIETEGERQRVNVERDGRQAAALKQYPYDIAESAELKYLLNVVLGERERARLVAACFVAAFGSDEPVISRDLYLTVDQVRELGVRGLLGTHGDEHIIFAGLSPREVKDRLVASIGKLSDWSGQAPFALSYPYGSYDCCSPRAAAGAIGAGLEFAFTGERAINSDLQRPFHLARFDCNDVAGGRHALFEAETMFERAPTAQWYR